MVNKVKPSFGNVQLYLISRSSQLIGEGNTVVYYNVRNTIYSLGIGHVVEITAAEPRRTNY